MLLTESQIEDFLVLVKQEFRLLLNKEVGQELGEGWCPGLCYTIAEKLFYNKQIEHALVYDLISYLIDELEIPRDSTDDCYIGPPNTMTQERLDLCNYAVKNLNAAMISEILNEKTTKRASVQPQGNCNE